MLSQHEKTRPIGEGPQRVRSVVLWSPRRCWIQNPRSGRCIDVGCVSAVAARAFATSQNMVYHEIPPDDQEAYQ